MAAIWPVALPQAHLEGVAEGTPDGIVRTQMDAGPPKVRRRFTAAVVQVETRVVLTDAQLSTFLSFFDVTLQGGTLPFEWVRPSDGSTVEFRFVSAPVVRHFDAGLWELPMSLEIVP